MKTFRACGLAVAAFFSLGTILAFQQAGGGAGQTGQNGQTTTAGNFPPTQTAPPEKLPRTRNVIMPNGEEMPVTGPVRPSQMRFTDEVVQPVELRRFGYEFFLPARNVIESMRSGQGLLSFPNLVNRQQQALDGLPGGPNQGNPPNTGGATGTLGNGQTTGMMTGGQTTGLSGQTTGMTTTGGLSTSGQTTGLAGQTTGAQTTGTQTTGTTGSQTTGGTNPPNANGADPNRQTGPNAYLNAFGPLNLSGLMASPPENYQLGPGDSLLLRVWSPTMEVQEFEVRIDQNGAINAPGTQKRVVLRGLTLAGARQLLLKEARLAYREADITVQLNELRTFSVSILGESFAPGTYQVPATFSLFNLLYVTGGPTDIGSLRDIQLKRTNGQTKHFDFYKMIRGDGSQDALLNPGDTIVIPSARISVTVKGEVVRPAIYELLPGETLRDAIQFADGTRATGVQQSISVDSVIPGVGRRLINADLSSNAPADNPALFDGDVVEVFSVRPDVRNAVAIMGAVDQPRVFALKEGMTVRDLVGSARGLMPGASTRSADLYRLNPDESYALLKIDLGKALQGDPASNLQLEPDDVLRVYYLSEIEFLQERMAYVQGAVRAPGRYYRADNMRVSDLIVAAGGLAPEASMEAAYLQRVNPDGTYGELITVDLLKAQAGDPAHDVLVSNRDVFRVLTTLEAKPTPEQMVEIAGAIQRPGLYPLASNMRIADLVRIAGMPAFDAFQEQVFVQRFNLDGTVGPLETVNLAAALNGDQAENILLRPRDKVSIYKLDQVQQRREQVVSILGAVQNPGTFPRSSDMSLADLIRLGGGFMLNVGTFAEIARSNVPYGTPVEKVDLTAARNGDLSSLERILIADGDVVTIPGDSNHLAKPIIVSIDGQVKNPGNYAIMDRNVRIEDLIERAGGLTESAWVEGGQFSRNPELLTTDLQRHLSPRVQEVFRIIQEDEYRRAVAWAELEKARVIAQAGNSVNETYSLYQMVGIPVPPYVQPKAVPQNQAAKNASGIMLVNSLATKARLASKFENVQGGNLYVNFKEAIRGGTRPHNLILMDGDTIYIPETPSTVFVDGPGIVFNQGVVFVPGRPLSYYIEQAGGLTQDASKDQIIVIRPSGPLYRPRMSTKIEAGDMIFVPTRVMVTKISNGQSTLDNVFRGITSAALIYGILKR